MKTLGIGIIAVVATALFGALAYTLYSKNSDELVLKTIVDPAERIVPGMMVEVDGMPAGSVRNVRNESGVVVASLAIENPLCRDVLREGTERIPSGERIYLHTIDVKPGAEKLRSGDIVRVRGKTTVSDFIPKLDVDTKRIAAVSVASLFVILALWKICRSLLPLGLSLLLALIVAWVAHPFVVPLVDQYLPKLITNLHSVSNEASSSGLAGLQEKLSELLSTRPSNNVVAFLLAALVSLPFCAILISMVGSVARRGISCALVGGCLLASLSIPAPIYAADITYSLKHLRVEQTEARKAIDTAVLHCENANRLLGANLVREASEKVTEGLFILDTVDVGFTDYDDRIQALKKGSLFGYSRKTEQKKLLSSKSKLDERIREVRDIASDIQKDASSISAKEANIIAVYLVLADAYRLRVRDGLTEWAVVLNECRQLAGFPLALVRSGVVNIDNVTRCKVGEDGSVVLPSGQALMPDGSLKRTEEQAKLSALEIEAEKLRRELNDVRKRQTQDVTSVTAPIAAKREVTKKPRAEAEKVKAPSLRPKRQKKEAPVIKVIDASTNPPLSVVSVVRQDSTLEPPVRGVDAVIPVAAIDKTLAETKPLKHSAKNDAPEVKDTNLIAVIAGANVSPQIQESAGAPYISTTQRLNNDAVVKKSNPISIRTATLVSIAVVIVVLMLAIAWVVSRQDRSHEISISSHPIGGKVADHNLVAGRGERIVLGEGNPRIEPADLDVAVPATISINARGKAEVVPGTATVLVNGEPIERGTTIGPGATIQLKRSDEDGPNAQTYSLRFIDPVETMKLHDIEEELIPITEEK